MADAGPDVAESIVSRYERFLDTYGDSPQGVGWPNRPDAITRHDVMLGLVARDPWPDRPARVSVLDVGCGTAQFLDHIQRRGVDEIDYTGLDRSARFVACSRAKHPSTPFLEVDLLSSVVDVPRFDYVVLNGVLTMKNEVSHVDMWRYARRLLHRCFALADRGLAFNLMSTHVDWERDDLFHVGFDAVATFVRDQLSRSFSFRQDYGLFEFTTYVYRTA